MSKNIEASEYMATYIRTWKDIFKFDGRATRTEFWTFTITTIILMNLISFLSIIPIIGWIFSILTTILTLPVLIVSASVSVRRLHDIGKSAWYWLLYLIPFLGIILYIFWGIQDSQSGTNQYGTNPKFHD